MVVNKNDKKKTQKASIPQKVFGRKDLFFDELPLFLQILVEEGMVELQNLKTLLKSGKKIEYPSLESYLLPLVGKERLLSALSRDYEVPSIDIEDSDISPLLGSIIPPEVGKDFLVACVEISEEGMTLAMINPRDEYAVVQAESKTDFKVVKRKVALYSDLVAFQELLYGTPRDLPVSPRDLVDDIIRKAVDQGASDIHVEPIEDDIKVRFRKDGMLIESYDIRQEALRNMAYKRLVIKHMKSAISVVVKNKSGASGVTMNIAETQKPQDGRIFLPVRNLDMRVSILPTVHGESIVIRILNPENKKTDFLNLGFSGRDSTRFERVIGAPYGIILVSGPTGSGKSTTLYTVLRKLNRPEVKILTVEDPVEYTIPGVMQVQTNTAKGVTFAETLRYFLRHDPDIIMIGEIRDQETASMAIESSLTGHLVLSTVHANDSVRTITRIKDLGVNPLLITSTCLGTMAQRLVRKNCPHCAENADFSPLFHRLMDHFKVPYRRENLVKSRGCPQCNHTGYSGRTGIYELMVMTQELRELILANAPDMELERLARYQGMHLLIEDALEKASRGITTEEEILRVTLTDYVTERKDLLEMSERETLTMPVPMSLDKPALGLISPFPGSLVAPPEEPPEPVIRPLEKSATATTEPVIGPLEEPVMLAESHGDDIRAARHMESAPAAPSPSAGLSPAAFTKTVPARKKKPGTPEKLEIAKKTAQSHHAEPEDEVQEAKLDRSPQDSFALELFFDNEWCRV
jgi:type II secretory ATPase GspE/PulE/Tfp pilus assembly ATPase PilB-like protein